MRIKKKVLVIDDEPQVGMIFTKVLQQAGYEVVAAASGEEGLKKLNTSPDVVCLDIKLPGMSGVETLRRIRKLDQDLPVVMMTAYQTVDSAVESMRLGACDYLIKPLDNTRIKEVVKHALLMKGAPSALSVDLELSPGELVGKGEAFQHAQKLISKVSPTELTVLLLGESGTGKELTARAIHLASKRADKAFVPVDCAALPESLMESELFGYEKGAFTGADEARAGRFEMANGGTLFLDEIGNLSMSVQAKLLRVLQDPSFVRLGSKQVRVNTRVVTATNKDLEIASQKGEFREDLYHRIKVFTIELTPLRNRNDDIPVLVDYYLKKYSAEMNTPVRKVSKKVMDLFNQYRWPGNIRELSNALRSAVVLAENEITVEDIPTSIRFSQQEKPAASSRPDMGDSALKDVVKKVEREAIRATLEKTNWNRTEAAKVLGIDYKTLYNKMREHGIKDK